MRRYLGFCSALAFLVACSSNDNLFADDVGTVSPDSPQHCVPGKQIECACPGGTPGAQACRDDGSGYLPCDCGAPAPNDGGSDIANDGGHDDGGNPGGDGGSDDGGPACSETSQKAERKPLDMYVMLDKSGSMAWNINGGSVSGGGSNPSSRWYQVTNALKAFVAEPQSAGTGVGLGYFPGSPECNATTYKTPAVSIGLLPSHGAAIETSLDNTSPTGGTPTRYALEGALQHAKEWSDQHPDHTVVVVLATDGEPSGCTNNSMNDVKTVASNYAAQGINTFVIGISNAPGDLDGVAQAGGTGQAIMVTGTNATDEFLAAMNQIRGVALACEYEVPPPIEGEQLDYEKVNLRFTKGNGTKQEIPYVDDSGQCGSGGWFYDNPNAPKMILVCPETCELFKSDDEGQVDVVLGCKRSGPA